MTALRLVGTFFLVVCGWCAGDAVCIRTQEHLEALRQTIALLEEIEQEGLNLLGVVPHDDLVYEYDCDGKPTVQLPDDSAVRTALNEIIKKISL